MGNIRNGYWAQKLHLIGFYGCTIQLTIYQPKKQRNINGKKNTSKIYLVLKKLTNQIKFQKKRSLKIMKLGRISIILIFFYISILIDINAEDKILTAPIINLEELQPSYENLEIEGEEEIDKMLI